MTDHTKYVPKRVVLSKEEIDQLIEQGNLMRREVARRYEQMKISIRNDLGAAK